MDNSSKKTDLGHRRSAIISLLDRFAEKVYGSLESGFFGRIFTSYAKDPGKIADGVAGGRLSAKLDGLRMRTARRIESCMASGLYSRAISYIMSIRLKVFGTVLLTFFLYASAVSLYGYAEGGFNGYPVEAVTLLLFALSSIPLLTSGASLYSALCSSAVGRAVIRFTGNRTEGYTPGAPGGRCNIAFLVGTVFGLLTLIVTPRFLATVLVRGIWALLAVHSPEFGIVSLCFLMPFDSTMTLVAETGVVVIAFFVKLILGKRTFRFEAVDIAALAFAVMLAIGGVFSVSASSLKPALVYICFMSAYFAAVSLLRSDEWLHRAVTASVVSGAIVALYGIYQYVTGQSSRLWLDSEMFNDISGRTVSTLENPNVLGEYLSLIIPMAAVLFLCRYTDFKRRFFSFAAFGCMCVCLIFTWSRGAWLGTMGGILLFLLIWNKRSLHMLWAAVLALPFLPDLLPENILFRITSIGNVADTSTAYRLNIWLGTIKMLPERILSGIGIGGGAWSQVYPSYALPGMSEVQHSHSLYFQIWVEMGAMALVVFVCFILILLMSNFTMYKKLSRTGDSAILRVSPCPLKGRVRESANSVNSVNNDISGSKRAARSRTLIRMNAAGPLCGVIAVLIQGFTDYMWYNYRVYLMFWLCIGICSAYASLGSERAESGELIGKRADASAAAVDIEINQRIPHKRSASK